MSRELSDLFVFFSDISELQDYYPIRGICTFSLANNQLSIISNLN
jgi:hypothetical protein